MNLEIIEKTRKRRKPGDIFALKVKGHSYLFGRVIKTDARQGGFDKLNLIYIYNTPSESIGSIPELNKNNLLIPPLMASNRPWILGYFKTVKNDKLLIDDILELHVFKHTYLGRYYDDQNNRLVGEFTFYSEHAMLGETGVNYYISKALGLPLSD